MCKWAEDVPLDTNFSVAKKVIAKDGAFLRKIVYYR